MAFTGKFASYLAIRGHNNNERRILKLKGFRQVLVLCTIVFFLAFAILAPRDNVVTIKAETEIFSYLVTNPDLSVLNVEGAQLFTDPFQTIPTESLIQPESYIKVTEGSRVRIRKPEGSLSTFVTIESEHASTGTLVMPDKALRLGPWASLKFTLNPSEYTPRIYPFRGEITLGDDVAPGVENILLSGVVSIAEEQLGFFNQERYLLLETQLEQGDRIQISATDGNSSVASDGFVRITAEGALSVVAHTVNSAAHVIRFGSAGYEIKPSVWARVSSDPSLSWLTALLATLLLAIELVLAVTTFTESVVSVDLKNTPKEKEEPSK